MSVTITACANSTPPAGTVIAACDIGGENYQLFIQTDAAGNTIGASGSPLFATITNLSGSVISAPTFTSVTNLAGSAAGSPLFVTQNNTTGSAAGSPTFVSAINLAGSAAGSPLFVSACITNAAGSAAGSPLFASITNLAGSAAGSPLFVSACITNLSGSAAGSPLFASITNQVSASISNAVTVVQGASGASPWGVRVLDAAGNAYGISSGSPLYIAGGAAGGTSASDAATFAEGTTSLTPIGGVYLQTTVALTASQMGMARITPQRGLHTSLRDESGNALGAGAASPLHVAASITNSPSVFVTSAVASPLFSKLSDGVDTVAVDAASRLLVTASFTDGLTVTSASVTVVNNGAGSPLFAKLTDGTDSVAVDAASRLLVTASFTDGLSVTAASVTIVNNSAGACVLYTSACITNLAGSAAGSPLFASITNQVSASISNAVTVTQGASAASPWGVRIIGADNGFSFGLAAASPLFVAASTTIVNSPSVAVINLAGSAAGSPLFTTASVTNIVTVIPGASGASPWGVKILDSDGLAYGTATASPLFAKLSDGVDSVTVDAASRLLTAACVVNTVTVTQGASGASPWGVRILDAAGLAYGVAAASPIFVTASAIITNSPSVAVINLAGSAAGSPLFIITTNTTGSAAGSPTFVSVANLSGSAAGSPLFVSACLTNLAGSAAGSPLFVSVTNLAGSANGSPLSVRVGDGVDTAFVDAACRLAVTLTDGTGAYGLPGSPLSQAGQGQTLYWAGSQLTIKQVNLSSSTSGSLTIIASAAGIAVVIVNATFTTSSCQFIGWIASGNGACAIIQTGMPFGTMGGMDAKRSPDSYLWAFPSGSHAAITTTSACNVAGTLNYISVAS